MENKEEESIFQLLSKQAAASHAAGREQGRKEGYEKAIKELKEFWTCDWSDPETQKAAGLILHILSQLDYEGGGL